jgi:MFS family permease
MLFAKAFSKFLNNGNLYMIQMKIKNYVSLILIFLIALVYRFTFLNNNPPGLYNDELYFLLSAYVQMYHLTGFNVPVYNIKDYIFYLLNGQIIGIILFHTSPIAARFGTAFYGSLMIFPIYLISQILFKNWKISIISSFLWAISPSAIVTSRVAFGVEIFPLFLFLFFILFLIKFIKEKRLIYLFISSIILIILFIFPPVVAWAAVPTIAFIIYILIEKIIKKFSLKQKETLKLPVFLLIIFGIVFLILFLMYLAYFLRNIAIFREFYPLAYEKIAPLPYSFFELGYPFLPWKLFLLPGFTIGWSFGPVHVPYMYAFLAIFFYSSLIIIPLNHRNDKDLMQSYYYLIALSIFGILITPMLFAVNRYYDFEPSEGIFSLPFFLMLSSYSIYRFFVWAGKKLLMKNEATNSNKKIIKNIKIKKSIIAILLIIIIIFAGVNISTFTYNSFVVAPKYYQENENSMYYPFYGWDQVSSYLVSHNLYNQTIYYYPDKEGSYNLTNVNNLNYWFWHQHFPQYWLYVYSGGLIKNVYLIYPNGLPSIPEKSAIILSQNSSYSQFLSRNGINNSILYTVYRSNNEPAIEVIEIYNKLNESQMEMLNRTNIFYVRDVDTLATYNVTSLKNITDSFTVSVRFALKNVSLEQWGKYSLINTQTPTFGLGIWYAKILWSQANNNTFWAEGTVYSNYGNYSAPGSWTRICGNLPIVNNTVYMLTMTYSNGNISLFINSTLVAKGRINYPLYPFYSTILYLDYNINATILDAEIWNTSLNIGEIGYLYYNQYYQENETSIYYPFYGWDQVSSYLVSHNLYNQTIYYYPDKEGSYNLTNVNNLNYWFWHQHFPQYWLYVYSGGLIKNVYLIYPNGLPSIPEKSAIILSQNSSYSQFLSRNGINNSILYTVYRSNNEPAIEVIEIYNKLNESQMEMLNRTNIFYVRDVDTLATYNVTSLKNITDSFTVSVRFALKNVSLEQWGKYSLINTQTPTFGLGIWYAKILWSQANNNTFWAEGTVYSNYGNYSAPGSWTRICGNLPIVNNTVYMLTMTYSNGNISLFINSTLVAKGRINYPLYPFYSTILYLDYNINATILDAEIWNTSLNIGEIGYLYYNPF